jgi:anti-sigma regulatory factor (Ser/Thr protein kinase)
MARQRSGTSPGPLLLVDFAHEHDAPESNLSDIRLAVSEAVSDAVVHAFRGRADGTVIASVTVGALSGSKCS